MPISLPTFEDTMCQEVGVCSHLKDDAPTLILPSDNIDFVSSYKAKAGKAFVHLVWNPKTKHCHVDVALHTAFAKSQPIVNTPITTLRKALAKFEGLTGSALTHGSFTIPLLRLPAVGGLIFVGNSAIKLSTGTADIELTGATLTFRRSEIRRIRWNLLKDKVWLDVTARKAEFPITGTYLSETLRTFESAVATYILGKNIDGKSRP